MEDSLKETASEPSQATGNWKYSPYSPIATASPHRSVPKSFSQLSNFSNAIIELGKSILT